MSEVLVISSSDEALKDAPLEFIEAIISGEGGYIKIEPNCPPPKVLWTLKSLVMSLGIGFQWNTIKKFVESGMHGEQAEFHVTTLLNNLITVEIPPLPNREEMEEIRKKMVSQEPPEESIPDEETPDDAPG